MSPEKLTSALLLRLKASQRSQQHIKDQMRRAEREMRLRRLNDAEATQLARRLHDMIEARASLVKGKRAKLVSADASSNKELHRLTLPPEVSAERRRLRKTLGAYLSVIRNLALVTGEAFDALDREFKRGTVCDPLCGLSEEVDDIHQVASALQEIVDRLNQRHGWAETFERTEKFKLSGNCWSHWPLVRQSTHAEPGTENAMADLEAKVRATLDPLQMFYRSTVVRRAGSRASCGEYIDAGHEQSAEFFFVPHAVLGHVLLWDLPHRSEDPVKHAVAAEFQLAAVRDAGWSDALPTDEWDEVSSMPRGQLDPRNRHELQHVFWLIAFPHPSDRRRITPALYQAGEEGGPLLMPIDGSTLSAVADGVWFDGDRTCSLLQRLQELLSTEIEGVSALEYALDRTGSWLAHNPVLKEESKQREVRKAIAEIASKAGTRSGKSR